MSKPIIAVDIDDVLAQGTEALRLEVNKRLGVDLQPEHYDIPGEYWGYYERVWRTNGLNGRITLADLSGQMIDNQSHVPPVAQSIPVLKKLAEKYKLIVITARDVSWEPATHAWIEFHFPKTFSRIIFAGAKHAQVPKSKGQTCVEIGASWLVDDNAEHCQSAIDEGVECILFGDYGWNRHVEHITRCKDWAAVLEYFDGR